MKVLLQLHIKMTIHLGQMESTSAVQVRFNTNTDRCKAPHEHNEGGNPHGHLRGNPKLKYAVSGFFCFLLCHMACGILVPHQGSNLLPCIGRAES